MSNIVSMPTINAVQFTHKTCKEIHELLNLEHELRHEGKCENHRHPIIVQYNKEFMFLRLEDYLVKTDKGFTVLSKRTYEIIHAE